MSSAGPRTEITGFNMKSKTDFAPGWQKRNGGERSKKKLGRRTKSRGSSGLIGMGRAIRRGK